MESVGPSDPWNQIFTLQLADGTPFNLTMGDIALYHFYGVSRAMFAGIGIGMSFIMLFAFGLLTDSTRRRSSLFVLIYLAIILTLIDGVLQTVYWTGPFQHPYTYFAADPGRLRPEDFATSVANAVIAMIRTICIQAALLIQVRAVLVTTPSLHKKLISVVAAVLTVFYFTVSLIAMVTNCRAIVRFQFQARFSWIYLLRNILWTANVVFYFLIFTAKLGCAIRERRRLGIRKLGPMEIIFIMSLNTMLVPALFTLLQFSQMLLPFTWFGVALVPAFLPLSSLWATASLTAVREKPTDTILTTLAAPKDSHSSETTAQESTYSTSCTAAGKELNTKKDGLSRVHDFFYGDGRDVETHGLGAQGRDDHLQAIRITIDHELHVSHAEAEGDLSRSSNSGRC